MKKASWLALVVVSAGLLVTQILAFRVLTNSDRKVQMSVAGLQREVSRPEDIPFDTVALVEGASPSIYTVRTDNSQGTAFVVSSESGHSTLLTAFHVIEDAWYDNESVEVVREGELYRGDIEAANLHLDTAHIVIEAELPPLETTDEATIGEPVLVIGSPYGFKGTVVAGLVSAIRPRYIQFSAPVSPGSSGSPVIDADGRVIGVVDLKVVTAAAEGLGFAVPISAL